MIVLIHPPVAKPCEPPAGIARLSGMLGRQGVDHLLLDANIEGLLHLLETPLPPEKAGDTWTKRARRNLNHNLSALKDPGLYLHPDRYDRAVRDIGRVLAKVSPAGASPGIADYEQKEFSPVKSADLLSAAEHPELNPYYPYFSMRLRRLFDKKKPSMAGISLNYLSQALCAFSMIGFMRREFPGLKIILGGGLVTSWSRILQWKDPFPGLVDHSVAGPGEHRLLELLGMCAAGRSIPMPEYRFLPRDSYLSPGFILPYSASTGCYWNRCDFCPEKAEGNSYVSVPPKQVINDLKTLRDMTGPSLIHLLDNAVSPALLEALCADNIGVPWYGFARVGPHLTDPAFCMELRRAGCVMLKLGIESGDQAVLDRLDKGISLDMASHVLNNLRRAGIAAYVYLIFGTPAETEASARKTLAFTVRHSDCIGFLNLAIFNMPVCSQHVMGMEAKGFYEGDLSLYTGFSHPQGWNRKNVRIFLDREFKRHPAVSCILKRVPPIFTSNHAPFFVMKQAEGPHTQR